MAASDSLSVIFTGDVLLDRGVRPVAEKVGVERLFAEFTPFFKTADATVINLECPITDTVSVVHKKYVFRADARWAKDLKAAGVTHAAMANNHTNDQGRRGLKATAHYLYTNGITPLGYGETFAEQMGPTVIEKGEVKVAVFNAVMMTVENWIPLDKRPGMNQPSTERLVEAVKNYRRAHPSHHIVALLHWGREFQGTPTMKQRLLARQLTDAGVDVIVGHHPHVIQPMEMMSGVPVFYSLGNFIFDHKREDAQNGILLKLTFKNGEKLEILQKNVKFTLESLAD